MFGSLAGERSSRPAVRRVSCRLETFTPSTRHYTGHVLHRAIEGTELGRSVRVSVREEASGGEAWVEHGERRPGGDRARQVRRVVDSQRCVFSVVVDDGLAEERARRREAVVEGARARLHGRRGDGRVVGLRRRGGRARRARGRRHVQRAVRVRDDDRRGRGRGGHSAPPLRSAADLFEILLRVTTALCRGARADGRLRANPYGAFA